MSGGVVAVSVPVPSSTSPPVPIQVQIPRAMSVSSVASGSMSPAGMCIANSESSFLSCCLAMFTYSRLTEKKQRKKEKKGKREKKGKKNIN